MQKEDESSEYDPSSSDSSPEKSSPFCPLYTVEVENAVKDGEYVNFTIMAKRFGDVNGMIINRIYEDIEWLHHCLTTQTNIDGIIIPPLPNRPEIDPRSAENKSKQQLGSDSKILQPDDFTSDSHNLQQYLHTMINHPAFGSSSVLEEFLTNTQAPVKSKVKKGLFSMLSDTVEGYKKSGHKDIDEYFQRTRDWVTDYSKTMKETSVNFNNVISSQLRLCSSISSLSAFLTISDGYKDTKSIDVYKILLALSSGLEQERAGQEKCSDHDEKTVGNTLDYYNRYMESVKAMLFRRTCLLLSYEEANKNYVKAKPLKKKAAEEAKEEAEKQFYKCSDTAGIELRSFLQKRILLFGETLTQFTEFQIRTSRETYTNLSQTLQTVRLLEI